jgi:hypothetical protein
MQKNSKYSKMSRQINSSYTIVQKIIIGLFFLLLISGWVLGIIGFGYSIFLKQIIDSTEYFKSKTNLDSSLSPDDEMSIPCTNNTLGNETAEFTGTTFLVSTCPKTENVCSQFACGSDGYCLEGTISGGTCYSNSQCGNSSRCDLDTCSCVDINQCDTTSDCSIISNNLCEEQVCILGICTTQTISGMNCSTAQECASNEYCASGCVCRGINQCDTTSDCLIISNNLCAEQVCILGVCTTQTISGMNCSTAQECGIDEFCGVGCTCISSGFSSTNLSWSVYTPTVISSASNLAGANFYDGVYYRVNDGFIEMQLYVEISTSTSNSVTKILIISTPSGITLDTSTNGAGVFCYRSCCTLSS